MFGSINFMDLIIVLACSAVTAALWLALSRRNADQSTGALAIPQFETGLRQGQLLVFDFDTSGHFLFANESGDKFLNELQLNGADWRQLRAAFINRFPGLPSTVTSVQSPSYRVYDPASPADPIQIGLEHHENGVTVQMACALNFDVSGNTAVHKIFSELSDLPVVRAASENAPHPIWLSRRDGRIVWANAAYRSLDMQIPRNASAPDAPLFSMPQDITPDQASRVSLRDTDRNRTYWYDVLSRTTDEGTLHFAVDVHAVVHAEAAQRNFVQTLAKTFAHLSTGLAIFDRNRQLVLFNPALIDLTSLPADFLSARPNLFSVFDQLRNNQIMPEPKNYANWRERIADVVTAASDGNFCETWALSTGQTYRITGRPHPDGAIAFLFEDISSEVSLTRRFRAEMEVTQSALNAMPDGVAIFSANGTLVQTNDVIHDEWGLARPTDDTQITVTDATRALQKACRPCPVWGEIRDFVASNSDRATWTGEATSKTGAAVAITVAPIAMGASLVTLRKRAVKIDHVPSKPARRKTQKHSAVA